MREKGGGHAPAPGGERLPNLSRRSVYALRSLELAKIRNGVYRINPMLAGYNPRARGRRARLHR
jgi:hypothetical protein